MKLKFGKNGHNRKFRPSDFLGVVAKSLLLNRLISKSIAEAFDEFLVDCKIEEKSPKTISFYRQFLRPFVTFFKPSTEMSDISPAGIKQYFLSQDHSKIYSYHSKYRALRAFLNWAVKQNYLAESPLKFGPPKLPDLIMPIFSDTEIRLLLKACDIASTRLRDRAIVLTLLDTGIRRGELLNTKLGDLDIEARTVTIMGKGRKQRQLHLSAPTFKAIWIYLKNRKSTGYDDLWLSEEGHPLTGDGVTQLIQRIVKRAGIEGLKASPHTFRHTFANNFLDSGGDPLTLKYLLGHSSLRMVERYSRAHQARRALKDQQKYSPVDRLGLK